jgi:hypothetical protein
VRFVESSEGQELAVLCLDYGYKLANTPGDLTRLQINFLMAALANRIERVRMARVEEPGVTKFVFREDDDA